MHQKGQKGANAVRVMLVAGPVCQMKLFASRAMRIYSSLFAREESLLAKYTSFFFLNSAPIRQNKLYLMVKICNFGGRCQMIDTFIC